MGSVEYGFVRVRVMLSSDKSVKRRARSHSVVPRLILAGAGAVLLTACTSDSSRFAESPFGASDRMATNSTPQASADGLPPANIAGGSMVPAPAPMAAPVSPVASAPLSAPGSVQSTPLAPLPASGRPNPGFSAPAAASPRLASASPLAASPLATGTARNLATSGNWTADGGTPITVAQGETADMLGARYGVPASALLAVNGLSSPSQISPGKRLIVPVYNASRSLGRKPDTTGSITPAKPAVAAAPAKVAEAAPVPAARPGRLHLVQGPKPAAQAQASTPAQGKPAKTEKPAKPEKPAVAAKPEKPADKPVKTAEAKPADKPAPRSRASLLPLLRRRLPRPLPSR